MRILNLINKFRFIYFCIILLPTFFMPISIYDEGIVLVNAQRILNGEFPNIDFWTIYPPGQFLVYSLFSSVNKIGINVSLT